MTPIRSALRLAVAALPALFAAASPAAAADERAEFDLYFGGLRAGALTLELDWTGSAYEARSEGRSSGLVGLFYEAFFAASASGAHAAGGPAPDSFAADASFGGKDLSLSMRWRDGAPREVVADPAYKPKPYQIDPAEQTGAIDPLTAAALLLSPAPLEDICGHAADVFDGRRRSRITLGAPQEVRGEILCPGRWSRVAGFRPKDMKKPDIPVRLWFRRDEAGRVQVERAVVETGYGLATAVRRD